MSSDSTRKRPPGPSSSTSSSTSTGEGDPPPTPPPSAPSTGQPEPIGGPLADALEALAARWATASAGTDERGRTLLVIAAALVSLARLLTCWWTPLGAELRRRALELGDLALDEPPAEPAPVAPAPEPVSVLHARRFGSTKEGWRVEREDGAHVCTVDVIAHHESKQGTYSYTLPDRPDVTAPFGGEGTFRFDVWDRDTVRTLVERVARKVERDALVLLDGNEPAPAPSALAGEEARLADVMEELRELATRAGKLPVGGLGTDDFVVALSRGLGALSLMAGAWGTPPAREVARRVNAGLDRLCEPGPDSAKLAAALDASPEPTLVLLRYERDGQRHMAGAEHVGAPVRVIAAKWTDDPEIMAARLTLAANQPRLPPGATLAPEAPMPARSSKEIREIMERVLVGAEIAWRSHARDYGISAWGDVEAAISQGLSLFVYLLRNVQGRRETAEKCGHCARALLHLVADYLPEVSNDIQRMNAPLPALVLTTVDREDLVSTIKDLGDAALDQTRPLARRQLGRATARENIQDAYCKALRTLGEVTHG